MKHASSLLLAAGLAAAQSSTVIDVLLPMLDVQKVEGSVISAGPTATTYLLNCPSGTPSDECGIAPGGFEVVHGPSTLAYVMSYSGQFTMTTDCTLDAANDIANCVGAVISQKSTSSGTETLTDYLDFFMPVTITAGIDKLPAATGPSSSEATTTAPSNTGATTPTPAPTATSRRTDDLDDSSDGSDESTDEPTDESESTSTSTGGVARITQNAAVLGAAALVGGAMLM